jgi:HEAT repeat protein
MKTAPWLLLLAVSAQLGCGTAEPSASAQAVEGGSGASSDPAIVLRYRLPAKSGGVSSAVRWELAAPVVDEYSDPNRIVYDDAYVQRYVAWAIDAPIACGPASYRIDTGEGIVEATSGLDERYLGMQFRAEALLAFLKTRVEGEAVEKEFRVDHPELGKLLRDHAESFSAKRIRQSPWDRDTITVLSLISMARHKPAYPLLKALAKDPVAEVRYSAMMGLGVLGAEVPEAIDDLVPLLSDKELGGTAADALTMAGAPAMPALIKAQGSGDWLVRNRAVHALSRLSLEIAEPGVLAALEHADAEVRGWAVRIVIDMQSRGVPVQSDKLIDAVARRLAEDSGDETRAGAAIALLNLGPAAASVRPVLEKAAKEDRGHMVATYAQRALEAIDAGAKPK